MYFGAVSWKFGDVVSYRGDPLELPDTYLDSISVGSSHYIFNETVNFQRYCVHVYHVNSNFPLASLKSSSTYSQCHHIITFPKSQLNPLFTVNHMVRSFKCFLESLSQFIVSFTLFMEEAGRSVCYLKMRQNQFSQSLSYVKSFCTEANNYHRSLHKFTKELILQHQMPTQNDSSSHLHLKRKKYTLIVKDSTGVSYTQVCVAIRHLRRRHPSIIFVP